MVVVEVVADVLVLVVLLDVVEVVTLVDVELVVVVVVVAKTHRRQSSTELLPEKITEYCHSLIGESDILIFYSTHFYHQKWKTRT